MFKKSGIDRCFFFATCLLVSLSFILVGGLWVHSEMERYKNTKTETSKDLYAKTRQNLEMEVEKIRSAANYKLLGARKRLETEVRERTEEAWKIANSLYVRDPAQSWNELASVVKEALRPIRFFSGRGYYFATRVSDGFEVLCADCPPNLENSILWDLRDPQGNYVIRDMARIVKEKDEGYYRYIWNNPLSGQPEEKTAFIKYFQPLDVFIGTGEYPVNIITDIKKEIIAQMELALAAGQEISAGTWEGLALIGKEKGKNQLAENYVGHGQIKEIIATAKNSSGFLTIKREPDAGGKENTDLVYAAGIPEWQWYISTRIDVEIIAQAISELEANFSQVLKINLFKMFGILLAMLIASWFFAFWISHYLKKNFRLFSGFLDQAWENMTEMDVEKIWFKDFRSLAVQANKNIAAFKNAEEEKRKLESALQKSQHMEAIGNLAGGIAHDFNNILAGVIGYSELALMDKKELPPKHEEYLRQILSAGNRAKDLILQILTFSRRRTGEKKPVDLVQIVQEAIHLIKPAIPSLIAIELSLPAEPVIINADATQMHQVLLNLCTNASQAMAEKGGKMKISLRAESVSNPDSPGFTPRLSALLEVSDTGPGIAQENLDRIFEPYFSTKEAGKGTCLGLAVVHGIIEGHSGRIAVKSTPGQGATFAITLPRISTQAITEKPEKNWQPGQKELVMLVDDEKMIRNYMGSILTRLGYRVRTAASAAEALARLAEEKFDVVITDMSMPEMSGKDLALEIKKRDPDLPIIICTGYSDQINPKIAREIGVMLFTKPLDISKLSTAMRKLLEDRQ